MSPQKEFGMSESQNTELPVLDVPQVPETPGIGKQPESFIQTLPPIETLDDSVPLSPKTGQPKRHPLKGIAKIFFYGSVGISAWVLCKTWWDAIHMATFPHAAHVIELFGPPRAGSWQSVLAAILMMGIGCVMVAVPWIVAFNSWNGHSWTRIGGLVAIATGALAWFMIPIGWLCVPLSFLGAVFLWLPWTGRYFKNWRRFRTVIKPLPPDRDPVVYGPLPRYQ
jgi:hypothetical protein